MKYLSAFILILLPMLFQCQHYADYSRNLIIIKDTIAYKSKVEQNSFNELIDIREIVPDIKLDIRYATDNNFTGEIIYESPQAYVRQPVALALKIVQQSLFKHGLGLLIFDAYRPYSATIKFYEVYKDTNYVASPWKGSRHNRGAAVDVSLVDLKTGEEIQMPTGFDVFSEAAHPDYKNLPENVIKNREILINEMQKHGFRVYPYEWWHFDFIGWEAFDLMDITFSELEQIRD
jgi:zinc D-Ala-D-Ala dipeptidase